MATLTADGINCSNGTLNGYYTGSAGNNTSYPIGSFLSCTFDNCSQTLYLNQSYTLYCFNNNTTRQAYTYSVGQLTLAGTWKARGTPSGLFQRVS